MKIANKKIHPSFIIYLVSMVLPIFFNGGLLLGIMGLFLGWVGILGGSLFISLSWISNFMYLFSLLATKLNLKTQIILSGTAIVLGLFAIGIRELPENSGGKNMEVYVGFGYIAWMASFIYLFVEQIKELNILSKQHSNKV